MLRLHLYTGCNRPVFRIYEGSLDFGDVVTSSYADVALPHIDKVELSLDGVWFEMKDVSTLADVGGFKPPFPYLLFSPLTTHQRMIMVADLADELERHGVKTEIKE